MTNEEYNRLTAFLYLLMRDEVVTGKVHEIINSISGKDVNIFSNQYLKQDAQQCISAIIDCTKWLDALPRSDSYRVGIKFIYHPFESELHPTKIDAIKLHRRIFVSSLREAKDFIESGKLCFISTEKTMNEFIARHKLKKEEYELVIIPGNLEIYV